MAKTQTKDPVRAYLASLAPDCRRALTRLRETIRSAAPDAVESISYGVLGYKLDGRPLVYAGGFTHHVGFYPLTPAIRRDHAAALEKYQTSKGTVRFPIAKPLPTAFITRLVKTRIGEVRARARTKSVAQTTRL